MRTVQYYSRILILCAAFSAVVVSPCRAEQLRAVKLYSGAALKLSDGRKIVYSGVSVPDKKDKPFYRECFEANRRLVYEKAIIVLEQAAARNKRQSRIPVLAFYGTQLINAELIRQGYALAGHSDDDFRYRDLFLDLQQEARKAGRGLWAYRETLSEPYYVGSRLRREFHRPDCSHAKNLPFDDRIIFRTQDEALSAGHIQDWRCCPLFRKPEADSGPQ